MSIFKFLYSESCVHISPTKVTYMFITLPVVFILSKFQVKIKVTPSLMKPVTCCWL